MADCNEKKENAPSEIMKKAEEYLASKRRIFLWGGVDDESAERIVKELLYLDSLNNEDIYFFINSPGGVISSGLAIYDCINAIKSEHVFYCLWCSLFFRNIKVSEANVFTCIVAHRSEAHTQQYVANLILCCFICIVSEKHIFLIQMRSYAVYTFYGFHALHNPVYTVLAVHISHLETYATPYDFGF